MLKKESQHFVKYPVPLGYSSFFKLSKKDPRKTITHEFINKDGAKTKIAIKGSAADGLASLEEGFDLISELIRRFTLLNPEKKDYDKWNKTRIYFDDLNKLIRAIEPNYENSKINKHIQKRFKKTLNKLLGTKYSIESNEKLKVFGIISGCEIESPKVAENKKAKDPTYKGYITLDPDFVDLFKKNLVRKIDYQLLRKVSSKAGELYLSLFFVFGSNDRINLPTRRLYEVYLNGSPNLEFKKVKYNIKQILKELVNENFIEEPIFNGESVVLNLVSKLPISSGFSNTIEMDSLIETEKEKTVEAEKPKSKPTKQTELPDKEIALITSDPIVNTANKTEKQKKTKSSPQKKRYSYDAWSDTLQYGAGYSSLNGVKGYIASETEEHGVDDWIISRFDSQDKTNVILNKKKTIIKNPDIKIKQKLKTSKVIPNKKTLIQKLTFWK
jgi:hypothetical protein